MTWEGWNEDRGRIAMLLGSVAAIAGCAANGGAPSALASATPTAASASVRVDNFLLVDQNLVAHELYHMSDASAVVLVTQQNGDAVVRGQAAQVNALAAGYGAKGVTFLMLNSSLKDSMDDIRAEAAKAGYKVPVLMDDRQLIGESLGVARSARGDRHRSRRRQVAYHGAVAGLPSALDALLTHQPVRVAATPSAGAAIDFPVRAAKPQIT